MCGIFGIIGSAWSEDFDRALDSLAHRGPDARGLWRHGPATLGHRRLAIIDLTGGAQPMVSDDGRYVLTFNGEIYNYRQLADELRSAGVAIHTHSDTEVLLKALIHWGRDALVKLDGIFAFGFWDRLAETLFLARDRFGIKPLYYSTCRGLVFASTLEPFGHLTGFPRKLHYPALREYLANQYIPVPMTILQDVAALPQACWLKYEAKTQSLRQGRYWDVPRPKTTATPLAELTDRVDAALALSVQRQMVADVPLGAFLSGGIDSSLMVHYMAQASRQPVKTFCIRFASIGDYDESRYARAVAAQYGCEHHELDAAELDGEHWAQAIARLDQPFADPAYLALLALSQLTRRHVTVAIAGDGGDELFAGYPKYLEVEQAYPAGLGRRLLRDAIEQGWVPGGGRFLRRALSGREKVLWKRSLLGPWRTSRKSLGRFVRREYWPWVQPDQTMQPWLQECLRFTGRLDHEGLMRGDLFTYLSDNCLIKTDRASMLHALEVRVPMLGNPVADLILPEPASVKLQHGLKTILKRLAADHLPREVWDRPKHGMAVPLKHSFQGPWRKQGQAWVDACGELAPFLDQAMVRRQWHATLHGRAEVQLTYALLALLGWLAANRLETRP